MDKIHIRNLSFHGHHGLLSEETKLGQRYLTSLVLELDTRPAGETDDLRRSIDYRRALSIVESVVTGPPCKLVETVAERIAEKLLEGFPILLAVNVTVNKPHPPVPYDLGAVAVEIRRERTP